ncbi:MAG: phage holin family protein [Ruminococcus flavefaciens]|nr:phage holin family protein [Ruminococcus flavefaciens]
MNITPIVEAIMTLIAAIITVVIVPYIRSKTTDTQRVELQALVQIAVTAAEQLYIGTGKGKEKKAYVLQWLNERGITVDTDKLDAMIESAVYELKTQT